MKEKNLRTPKLPAINFLFQGISSVFIILSSVLMVELLDKEESLTTAGIIRTVIFGAANLFMSYVLFSKKYNKILLIATGLLVLPSVFSLFLNISVTIIVEIIFYIVLSGFTYIMIKMPDTPLRERTVKLRFIIPVLQFIILFISTIESIKNLHEKLLETMGSQLNDPMNLAATLVPIILTVVSGLLPLLCFILLPNWLADPYKK